MSKDKAQLRIRQGTGLARVDGDAVQRFWLRLSLQEKRDILRFEDPELVERLFSIWQALCISDMTCYVVGIGSQDCDSKKAGNEFFAIEGFISQSAVLHEAAFYAKLALVDKPDFFEILEEWLGSPPWVGRTVLHRRDWPSLFKASMNSWSEFVRQIFKLIESALYHAEQVDRIKPAANASSPDKVTSPSKCSKRKARKKSCNLKLKICPVCDGTRVLLGDPCPLCVDISDDDEPPHTALIAEEELIVEEKDEEEEEEKEEFPRLSKAMIEKWSSGWRPIGKRCDAAGGHWVLFDRPIKQSACTLNKHQEDMASVSTDMSTVSTEDVFSDTNQTFEEQVSILQATVKNTFVHMLPDCPSAVQGLSRSRSLPCW